MTSSNYNLESATSNSVSPGRKKRRIWVVILFLLVVALVVYLNRAYAHVYQVIGAANLQPATGSGVYVLNNNMITKESLAYTALGDSLSAGAGVSDYREALPYLLSQNLAAGRKKITLKNRSLSGATAHDLVVNFLDATIEDNPDIVTVLIGANDVHNRTVTNEFQKNYEQILSRLSTETNATVYAVSLPFIGANSLMSPPYQTYFDLKTKEFNKIIKKLADRYGVKYVDLYSPTVDLFKTTGAHYSADLFHPSAAGYKIWADIIYADLSK